MELQACYQQIGGDYAAVIGRLGKEERVVKFLKMFLADESFPQLADAMEKQDWSTAFRAAHTLKGVALNLALTQLAGSASALTECLRSGAPAQDPEPLYQTLHADYDRAAVAIGALD